VGVERKVVRLQLLSGFKVRGIVQDDRAQDGALCFRIGRNSSDLGKVGDSRCGGTCECAQALSGGIQLPSVRRSRKCIIFGILLLEAIGLDPLPAQTAQDSSAIDRMHASRHVPATLSVHDGLSIVAAARHMTRPSGSEGDCSHLVHRVYAKAGFSYKYANSSDLYRGVESFERVARPQPGDLIVWQGHAGIVTNPTHHLFFSALRHRGPGMDHYDGRYWKRRGPPHFFRYIKWTDS